MAMNERLLAELLGLATLCFLCGFWFLPEGVLALRRRAHGELQVDTRLGYNPKTLYRLLRLYGPDGIRSFRRMLLADMIFPAVYGALLFVIGDLVIATHPTMIAAGSAVRVMAIAAAAFDYLENFFLLRVLRRLPEPLNFTARMAGICTSLKMFSFIVALGALATALLSHTGLFCNGPFVVNPSPLFLRRFTLLSVVSAAGARAAT
jgi:hypothetical protein